MIEYKNAKEIFKEKGYEWVKGWVAELDKRNIKERTEREIEAKRLVESWELVESKGGLAKCKEILDRDSFTWCSGSRVYANPLKIAVADVESCQ